MGDITNSVTPNRVDYRKANRIMATYGRGGTMVVRDDAFSTPAFVGSGCSTCAGSSQGGCGSCDKLRSPIGIVPRADYSTSPCPPYGGLHAKTEKRMHAQWTNPEECGCLEPTIGPLDLQGVNCPSSKVFNLPNPSWPSGGRCLRKNCGLFDACGKRSAPDYGIMYSPKFHQNMDSVNEPTQGATGESFSHRIETTGRDGFKSGRFSVSTRTSS